MPAKLDINREAIKTLVIAHGVREAARIAGINEDTVSAWSARFGWHKEGQILKTIPKPICKQSPSNALASSLSKTKDKSRVNLARFVLNGSKVAARSRSPLADAGKVKDLASVMEKVWPEEKSKNDNGLVAIQLIRMELPKEKEVQDYSESQATIDAQ